MSHNAVDQVAAGLRVSSLSGRDLGRFGAGIGCLRGAVSGRTDVAGLPCAALPDRGKRAANGELRGFAGVAGAVNKSDGNKKGEDRRFPARHIPSGAVLLAAEAGGYTSVMPGIESADMGTQG